jgi:hypothetical protein
MKKNNEEKIEKFTQKFAVEVRFVYSRLQELLFKGARKCAQDEERKNPIELD